MVTKPVAIVGPAQEVAEVGESSMVTSSFAEEPQTDEAVAEVNVVIGGTEEEMPIASSEAVAEPTIFEVDIPMAESQARRPLEVAEQEAVMEIPCLEINSLIKGDSSLKMCILKVHV